MLVEEKEEERELEEEEEERELEEAIRRSLNIHTGTQGVRQLD